MIQYTTLLKIILSCIIFLNEDVLDFNQICTRNMRNLNVLV